MVKKITKEEFDNMTNEEKDALNIMGLLEQMEILNQNSASIDVSAKRAKAIIAEYIKEIKKRLKDIEVSPKVLKRLMDERKIIEAKKKREMLDAEIKKAERDLYDNQQGLVDAVLGNEETGEDSMFDRVVGEENAYEKMIEETVKIKAGLVIGDVMYSTELEEAKEFFADVERDVQDMKNTFDDNITDYMYERTHIIEGATKIKSLDIGVDSDEVLDIHEYNRVMDFDRDSKDNKDTIQEGVDISEDIKKPNDLENNIVQENPYEEMGSHGATFQGQAPREIGLDETADDLARYYMELDKEEGL